MSFTSDFEILLEKTICSNTLSQARQLADAYPSTNLPYTLKIYSLLNELQQKEFPFRIYDPNIMLNPNAHIVIYLSDNYILRYIARQFASFFQKRGCQTFLFDVKDFAKITTDFFQFAKQGISAAFFFNHVGLSQLLENGTNLWGTLHIPCYDFVVDHPMYYADSLDQPPARTTLLCADRTHVTYAQKYYPHLQSVCFLPTGGCNPCQWNNNSDFTDDYRRRPIDLLFIGSYKSIPLKYSSFDLSILEYLRNNPSTPFDRAMEILLRKQLSAEEYSLQLCKEQIETHRYLETNITSAYRKDILEAFLKKGLTIEVYGQGWADSGLTQYPNFHLSDSIPFEEGLAIMEKAKIVLNHMAWFKEGSSERIFNAMAQGAVCCTDSSIYLDTILIPNHNCMIYQLTSDSILKCAEGIHNLLSSPNGIEKLAAIAYKGWQLSAGHTWESHLSLLFSR